MAEVRKLRYRSVNSSSRGWLEKTYTVRACEPSQRLKRVTPRGHVRESSLHEPPRVLESAEKFQKDSLHPLDPYANQDSQDLYS